MTPSEFAKFVRAAARQQRLLLPRRQDRALLARGGTLLHAVDTDVIKLFTSPSDVAPSGPRGGGGYAEVFPNEDRGLVVGLGTALARFIFSTLDSERPLLLLPPMGDEVREVFAGVARDAALDSRKAPLSLDRLKGLVNRAKQMDDREEALRLLESHAAEIARIAAGPEGPPAELDRFARLIHGRRLASPDYLLEQHLAPSPEMARALESPSELIDRIRLHQMRRTWFERLHRTKSAARETALTDTDAQVLARLEWINHALSPPSRAKPKHRVVLITGDQSMFDAASSVKDWEGSGSSFADLFLRHPKAYLSEPQVLAPPDPSSTEPGGPAGDTPFDEWLDTWLSRLHPGTDSFRGELDTLLSWSDEVLADWVTPWAASDAVQELKTNWLGYTRSLTLERPLSDVERRVAEVRKDKTIEAYEALIGSLSDAIDARIRDTWEGCFGAVALGSYMLASPARDADAHTPSRNAPLLTFDRFQRTRAFVNQVLRQYRVGGLSAEQWRAGLHGLDEDDPSGYAFFVALGVLFAAEGVWKVAGILAEQALMIATRDKPKLVTGREAAYLRAVALRHSARSVAELKPIAALLDRAEAAHRQDLAGHPGLEAGPCRFEAERWALHLTYHLYRVLLKAPMPDHLPDPLPALAAIQNGIDAMLLRLDGSDQPKDVRLYTERNLTVNWLMAALLRLKDEALTPEPEQVARHLDRLEENIREDGDQLRPSYYVEAVRLLGRAFATRDPALLKAHKREAAQWLRDYENHCVMKYDAARFMLMRNICISP